MARRLSLALRSGHWPSLIAAWLHFEVSFMSWLLIAALGISIAEELELSVTEQALLVAVPLLGGAVLRIPVGLACDWMSPKSLGLVLLLTQGLALIYGWQGSPGYGQLLGVGLMLGTAGASFAVALPLVSRAYPVAHHGLAMGVAASANSGTMLVAFLAPRLAIAVGWQEVFGLMVIPVLVTAILFLLMVPGQTVTASKLGDRTPIVRLLTEPSMYWLCLLYSVTFGGFVGFCSFLPMFLHDAYNVDHLTAGSMTAACGLAGSLVRPLGGYQADRVGGPPLAALVLLGAIILLSAMALEPPLPLAGLLMIVLVTLLGLGNGIVFRIVSDLFNRHIGGAAGIVGAAGALGGFLLPIVLGGLRDVTGNYRAGVLLLAALTTVTWAAAIPRLQRAVGRADVAPARRFSH